MEEQLSRDRAQQLIKEAEGEQGTFFLWRSKDNFSSAAKLYKEAGVQLKIAKDFKESSQLFLKAAEIYTTKCDDKMNTAICYNEAGLVLRQVDMSESVKMYKKCAELYQLIGRPAPSAKIWDEIAVMYDQDLFDRENAVKCHISAGDCYKAAKSEVSAHACYLKAANLMALDHKFLDAVKLYEVIADYYSRQSQMPHQVNTACYKSLLCMLVQEVKIEQKGKVTKTLEKYNTYTSIYPTFEDHDDAKLVHEIITHYENNDMDAFQASLNKRKYKLDTWAIDMLVIVKRAMEGEPVPTGESENPRVNVAKPEQFDTTPQTGQPTASENIAEDLL